MWTTFTISLLIALIASYFFFTAHRRRPRALEGMIALASTMICLGIAPVPIKIVLLITILGVEQWRVRWEKAQKAADASTNGTL